MQTNQKHNLWFGLCNTTKRQLFEGCSSISIACRFQKDALSIFGSKTIVTMKLMLSCGLMVCHQTVKWNRKEVKEMFLTASMHFQWAIASFIAVHHTTVWQYLRKKLNISPYRLKIEQICNVDKKNLIVLVHLAIRRWRRTFISSGVLASPMIAVSRWGWEWGVGWGESNEQTCRIWATKHPKHVYELLQSS